MSNAPSVADQPLSIPATVNADVAVGMGLPSVVVGHDRVDALVEVVDAEAPGRAVHAEHDLRAAAGVVRVREAVGVAELVQDDGVGDSRRAPGFAGYWPKPPLSEVEDADALLGAVDRDPADRSGAVGRRRRP